MRRTKKPVSARRRWLLQSIVGLVTLPLSALPIWIYATHTPVGELLSMRVRYEFFARQPAAGRTRPGGRAATGARRSTACPSCSTASATPRSRSIIRTAFVATYPPRRCGIATFTHDLARRRRAARDRRPPPARAGRALPDRGPPPDPPGRARPTTRARPRPARTAASTSCRSSTSTGSGAATTAQAVARLRPAPWTCPARRHAAHGPARPDPEPAAPSSSSWSGPPRRRSSCRAAPRLAAGQRVRRRPVPGRRHPARRAGPAAGRSRDDQAGLGRWRAGRSS